MISVRWLQSVKHNKLYSLGVKLGLIINVVLMYYCCGIHISRRENYACMKQNIVCWAFHSNIKTSILKHHNNILTVSTSYIQTQSFASYGPGTICLVSKKWYGCKWTWDYIQHYPWTQINVKEQYFYCCSTFHSHSRIFNNENNPYHKCEMAPAVEWYYLLSSRHI